MTTQSEPLETVLKGTYRHKRSGTIYTRVTVQNGIYTVTNEKGSQYFVNGDKLERVPLETPGELDEKLRTILGEEDWKYTDKPAAIERLIADEVRKARIDERNGMQFFDQQTGEETHLPYLQYRYTGDGFKLNWDDRTKELEATLTNTESNHDYHTYTIRR